MGSVRIGRSDRIVSANVSEPDPIPSSVPSSGASSVASSAAPHLPPPQRSVGPAVPHCSLFGRCGGCQLQNLAYDEQLALKTEGIRALFPEDIVAPCVPSPRPYGYRSKLTPHFPRPRADRPVAIGFLEVGLPRRTLDVPTCPIATPAVNARLAELRAEVLGRRATYKGATLLVREAVSGVTVDPREVITEQVGELSLQFLAGDFFQNNPFLLPRLAAYVAAEAQADGARFLVDAYCGSGLLALAAAPASSGCWASRSAPAPSAGPAPTPPATPAPTASSSRPTPARSSPPSPSPLPTLPSSSIRRARAAAPISCANSPPSRRARLSTSRATPRRRLPTWRGCARPATAASACSRSTCSPDPPRRIRGHAGARSLSRPALTSRYPVPVGAGAVASSASGLSASAM